MNVFKLYHALTEDLREKYDKLNYWTLEELWGLPEDEAFKVELYWVTKNEDGKERHARYASKSKGFDYLMHDMVNGESPLRKKIYDSIRGRWQEAAKGRITKDEEEKGFLPREIWILCCEELLEKMGSFEGPNHGEGYLLEGYTLSSPYFRFTLPREIPPKVLHGTDLEFFTNPSLAAPCQFKLMELLPENVFKYALIPFYYNMAKYCTEPISEETRDITGYYVGLA